EMPLAEVIYDFYDRLKSSTKGYGTMDYDFLAFRPGDLVKLDILVNGDRVDALSVIVHKEHSEARGRRLLVRLKKEISKHLFEIPLQAAIGGKIIARETIKSVGKNVTAKCYGGDGMRHRVAGLLSPTRLSRRLVPVTRLRPPSVFKQSLDCRFSE